MKILFLLISISLYAFSPQKIFPIISVGDGKTVLSIYKASKISQKLNNEIVDYWKKLSPKKELESFRLPDGLRSKTLNSLGVYLEDQVFIYNMKLNQVENRKLKELSDLRVYMNLAADGLIGVIGFPLQIEGLNAKHALASLSKKNPFEQGLVKRVQWQKSSQKKFNFKDLPDEKTKSTVQNFQFFENGIKLYHTHIKRDHQNGYVDEKFGLLVISSSGDQKKIMGETSYDYFPKIIYTGKLFKEAGEVFYSESTGMGNCGHLYYQDKNRKWQNIELNCGVWGC